MDLIEEYILKDECYKVIGCCMTVHKELGCGFFEAVYQEALELEFTFQKIPYAREKVLDIFYKNCLLNKKYIPDFICYESLIVELKAVDYLADEHIAQVLNYLKATGLKIGLLINFGNKKLQYQRVIF